MKSFSQWLKENLGHSLIPQNIPRLTTSLVGNEIRTDAGRLARNQSGESERRYDIKIPITALPAPSSKHPRGLGYLGLKSVGASTFKESPPDGKQIEPSDAGSNQQVSR